MKTVELSSLNIDKLYEIREIEGSEASLYSRGFNLIKVYNYKIDRKHRMQALSKISNLKIENVIIPHSMIVENGSKERASGCIMRYYKKAEKLNHFFCNHDKDQEFDTFLSIVRNASMTLKEIHELGLVCGDISFTNILYLPNFSHLFCDFDGISIDNIGPESGILSKYRSYHGISKSLNKDSDKLSMYLWLLYYVCGDSFLSKFEYDGFCEKYPFLDDSKHVYDDVIKRYSHYPKIPYLHEIIPGGNKK